MFHFDLTDEAGNCYRLSPGSRLPIDGSIATHPAQADALLYQIEQRQLLDAREHFYTTGNFHLLETWRQQRLDNRRPPLCPREDLLQALCHGELAIVGIDSSGPAGADSAEGDRRNLLRVEIRRALAQIIAGERAEAAQHARLLARESTGGRALIYTGAFFNGLWNAGADLAQWLKEVNDVVNPVQRSLRAMHSSYRALQRSRRDGDNIVAAYTEEHLKAEKRELVEALGFDPSAITAEQLDRAMEVADLIWDDPALRADITRFARDYASAQHALEITEISGGAAFEVLFTLILAAITAGAGLAASAASQARHLAKFRRVGDLLMEFAEQARRAKLARERSNGGGEAASFDDFESLGEVEPAQQSAPAPTPRKERTATRGRTDFSQRKGVPPSSLDDAVNRLNSMADEIARNGYQPKYTDAELQALADSGDVSNERYHVRFMESRYLTFNGEPGMLGAPMQGTSGNGAKYWSTTFDQLEDADTDSRLIAEKLGLDYDPDTEYALVVIDTEKATPLTGVKSVPATFDKVGEFANRELPDEFPAEFTETAMTPEFQAEYSNHYQAALDAGYLDSSWSTERDDFGNYLSTTDVPSSEQKQMLQRMYMQQRIGNNQYYEGNGLTRDKISGSSNQFGAVETLNFERKPVNLQQLEDAGAISYVSKGF
ncbi:hypothetical protein [Microbulbifer litoralis]|uniref:hypothetical protein n=1 Tax=Microbulbifer litoralis TaxID=2933965 RepID=UPI0020283B07|nr:hypothetical protein [Microbulbifer sp. GX H0434]